MILFEQYLHIQITNGDPVLNTNIYEDHVVDITFYSMTHYEITKGNDITRNVHYDIIVGNDIAMGTNHDVTMHTDIAIMDNYGSVVVFLKSVKLLI